MTRDFSFASFYSGAGGMDYGFKKAGFLPVFANDIDPIAIGTLNRFLGVQHGIAADVSTIELPNRGSVDVVIGGPPCQGFSVAGKMDPRDPRSDHVWKFLEIVSQIRPRAFVMENVKNLAVNDRWASLKDALIEASESLGYSTKLFLLSAADFGVPQNRERMFLVGIRGSMPIAPLPTSALRRPTVREAFQGLPMFGQSGNDTYCTAIITTALKPVLRKSAYAGMLFNGAGRPMNPDAPAPTLPASMGGNRTPIVDQRMLEGDSRGFVEDYHSHLSRGGEVWREVTESLRRITVEEAACLQSFPRGMYWAGSVSAKFRQIGNAVPPELAFHVALSLKKVLEHNEPDAVEDFSSSTAEELRERANSALMLL